MLYYVIFIYTNVIYVLHMTLYDITLNNSVIWQSYIATNIAIYHFEMLNNKI